ncbi:hypothetical protein NKH18_48980 [Streptomyces sp. M10(2022)]
MTSKAPAQVQRTEAIQILASQHTALETSEAAEDLRRALRDAGIDTIGPRLEGSPDQPYVHMGELNAYEAAQLALLVRKGLHRVYRVAARLHETIRAHGLHDFPTPTVCRSRIQLGDVSVATADRLARLLGASPQANWWRFPTGPRARRLSNAFTSRSGPPPAVASWM